MTAEMQILDELLKRFRSVEKNDDGYEVIEITFKATGNKWTLKYMIQWTGNRRGFRKHCVAIHNGKERHFRDIDTLSRAIAAGYIR